MPNSPQRFKSILEERPVIITGIILAILLIVASVLLFVFKNKNNRDNEVNAPVQEEEKEKIDEWSKTHECTTRGTRVQGYRTFLFSPTELGIVGEVKCSCGKTFIFSELS